MSASFPKYHRQKMAKKPQDCVAAVAKNAKKKNLFFFFKNVYLYPAGHPANIAPYEKNFEFTLIHTSAMRAVWRPHGFSQNVPSFFFSECYTNAPRNSLHFPPSPIWVPCTPYGGRMSFLNLPSFSSLGGTVTCIQIHFFFTQIMSSSSPWLYHALQNKLQEIEHKMCINSIKLHANYNKYVYRKIYTFKHLSNAFIEQFLLH